MSVKMKRCEVVHFSKVPVSCYGFVSINSFYFIPLMPKRSKKIRLVYSAYTRLIIYHINVVSCTLYCNFTAI